MRFPNLWLQRYSINVIKCIVFTLYDDFVYLPRTEGDWANECSGFIENYEFS